MRKIGLISDTHGLLEERVFHHFQDCDEIWHAGDFGEGVAEQLREFKPMRGVYGNIDVNNLKLDFPEHQVFMCEGMKVWMTHIGAYPPNYNRKIKSLLNQCRPNLFICGHSHILRVMGDKARGLWHINPGAAGNHGFHHIKTIMTICIHEGKLSDVKVIELGKRGSIVGKTPTTAD